MILNATNKNKPTTTLAKFKRWIHIMYCCVCKKREESAHFFAMRTAIIRSKWGTTLHYMNLYDHFLMSQALRFLSRDATPSISLHHGASWRSSWCLGVLQLCCMNRPTITYDGQTMFCSYRKSPKENLRMEMMRMLMLTMTIGKMMK